MIGKMDIDQVLNVDENLDDPQIEKLRNQRLEGIDTDLVVNCGGKSIRCHRSVLTASCSFFERELNSNDKNEIELDWQDHLTFELILDYLYTGKIELNNDNIERVLGISDYLSISKLKHHCEQFIETFVDLHNCLTFKQLCEAFKLSSKLLEHCVNFINDNLMHILNSNEFLSSHHKNVELFLTDPETGCDYVPLVNLIEVLSKWLLKDVESRANDYRKLLSILDWSSCTNDVFDYLKKNDKLFENKFVLYLLLSTMESNGIDLDEDCKRIYSELKEKYLNGPNSTQSSDNQIIETSSSISNQNLSRNSQTSQSSRSLVIDERFESEASLSSKDEIDKSEINEDQNDKSQFNEFQDTKNQLDEDQTNKDQIEKNDASESSSIDVDKSINLMNNLKNMLDQQKVALDKLLKDGESSLLDVQEREMEFDLNSDGDEINDDLKLYLIKLDKLLNIFKTLYDVSETVRSQIKDLKKRMLFFEKFDYEVDKSLLSFFVTDLKKEKYLDKLNVVKDALVQIENYEKQLENDDSTTQSSNSDIQPLNF